MNLGANLTFGYLLDLSKRVKVNFMKLKEFSCTDKWNQYLRNALFLAKKPFLTFRFSKLRTFFSTMARAWVTMLFSVMPAGTISALLGASMGLAEAQSTGIVTASVSRRPAAHYSFQILTKHSQTDFEPGSENADFI